MNQQLPDAPEPGSEGARLFDAMVRWQALATSLILLGFAGGLAHLVFTGTTGSSASGVARGLALVAVVGIVGGVVASLAGYRARRRFNDWYRSGE